jgi:hypothetical protein
VIRGVVILACLVAAFLTVVPSAVAAGPLRTAIVDPAVFEDVRTFERTRAAGATLVRFTVAWRNVVGGRPAQPENPRDPAYDWRAVDQQVTLALRHGLEPLVTIMWAPDWAEGPGSGQPGTVRPDPTDLRQFARAAAIRYSGDFPANPDDPYSESLPRIRYWQVWNEPNREYFLSPQYAGDVMVAADWYRRMVNAFADAVHGVDPSNFVVAGGTAPFRRLGHPAPLAFMRAVLCMSRRPHRPTCAAGAEFDAWAHHPYTSGGPTRQAFAPDDVSIGDLPEMRRLLRAAGAAGHVVARRTAELWVTEFSWDTRPPDRWGVPTPLHARWVAEGLYRMWRSDVTTVTWFLTKDEPVTRTPYQSGLYFADGRPKLAWQAFRFPVVAFPVGRRVYVWGRTPWGQPGRVIVQQKTSRRWRTVAAASTNGYGIFSRRLRIARRGFVRARLAGGSASSVPFSLRKPRECYVNAFGGSRPPLGLRPVC